MHEFIWWICYSYHINRQYANHLHWITIINSQGAGCSYYKIFACNPRYTDTDPCLQHPNKIQAINTLRLRRNGRHFADEIFKRIFLNENILIPVKMSLKFVPKGSINNIPALVQIMAWRRPSDKPLSEPMMVNLPTHICVTRPQWVNRLVQIYKISSNG